MKKIGDITNTADKNGEFTDGNVAAGTPPTQLMGAWFNSVQREILNVLVKAGIPQSATKEDQLTVAIETLIGSAGYLPTGYSYSKVESNLKFQPIGNYQPSGDYATNTALNNGLALKLDKTSIVQSTGSSTTGVISQLGVSKALENKADAKVFVAKTTSGNSAITPVEGDADFVFYKDGSMAIWDRTKSVFRVSKSGKVEIGDIPYSNVSGIPLIGIDQKWVDVTSQRQKSTKYTNTTNKPILVIIGGSDSRGTAAYVTCDDVNVGYLSKLTVGVAVSITFLVPSGSTYQLGDFNFTFWSELR